MAQNKKNQKKKKSVQKVATKKKIKKTKPKKISNKILVNLILVAIILMAAFLFLYYFSRLNGVDHDEPVSEVVEITEESCPAYRFLDGVCVSEGEENLLPVGIMIENYVEARPPHNLTKAGLVYEALTEGGISRFLAVYTTAEEITKIGPVRSARPYFIEWAVELGAIYMHCGGSPAALTKLNNRSSGVTDVNEFYRGNYFWRDSNLARPHNIFTSSQLIRQFQENRELAESGDYPAWQFVDDPPLVERSDEVAEFSFNYSPYHNYYTEWHYNKEENQYYRYQAEEPHLDKDGTPVIAKNIIFQYIPTIVLDNIGRKQIKTRGNGQALIFQNGGVDEGIWQKDSLQERTKFYYNDSNEVKFNRGPTWIIAMPIGYEIKY